MVKWFWTVSSEMQNTDYIQANKIYYGGEGMWKEGASNAIGNNSLFQL